MYIFISHKTAGIKPLQYTNSLTALLIGLMDAVVYE